MLSILNTVDEVCSINRNAERLATLMSDVMERGDVGTLLHAPSDHETMGILAKAFPRKVADMGPEEQAIFSMACDMRRILTTLDMAWDISLDLLKESQGLRQKVIDSNNEAKKKTA